MAFAKNLKYDVGTLVQIADASKISSELMRVQNFPKISDYYNLTYLIDSLDPIADDIRILLQRLEFFRERLEKVILEYRDSALYHLGRTIDTLSKVRRMLDSPIRTLKKYIDQVSGYHKILTNHPTDVGKSHQEIKVIYTKSHRSISMALIKSKETLINFQDLL